LERAYRILLGEWIMETVSVSAHFDGERIRLDEPIELEPNAKLIVTILPKDNGDWEVWLALSAERLLGAYGESEEEYLIDSIKEANAEYEAPIPHKSSPR
jgi:hypothetical protein